MTFEDVVALAREIQTDPRYLITTITQHRGDWGIRVRFRDRQGDKSYGPEYAGRSSFLWTREEWQRQAADFEAQADAYRAQQDAKRKQS